MTKNLPLIIALLTTVGLFAEPRGEFSLLIRPVKSTARVGSPVEIEVKTINLTSHDLEIGNGFDPTIYTYNVKRDGMLVAQTELSKKLKHPPPRPPCKQPGTASCVGITDSVVGTEPLAAHQTRTETIAVSEYRDMSQPGTYTIQLLEVDSIVSGRKVHQSEVRSNIVTVTVDP